MKITDGNGIKNVFIQKPQPQEERAGKNFDEILNKKMQEMDAARPETLKSGSARGATPLFSDTPIDREEVVALVSRFLDVMEEYSVQLSNGRIPLKELAPLVARMQAETETMKLLSASLPLGDDIKGILDETLIRSSVEVIKFNRGDYL